MKENVVVVKINGEPDFKPILGKENIEYFVTQINPEKDFGGSYVKKRKKLFEQVESANNIPVVSITPETGRPVFRKLFSLHDLGIQDQVHKLTVVVQKQK